MTRSAVQRKVFAALLLAYAVTSYAVAQAPPARGGSLRGLVRVGQPVVHRLRVPESRYFFSATVDAAQTDIEIGLVAPSGAVTKTISPLTTYYGAVSFSGVLLDAGEYALNISASGPAEASGYYEIQISELRPVTNDDIRRSDEEQSLAAALEVFRLREASPDTDAIFRKARAYGETCVASTDRECSARAAYISGLLLEAMAMYPKAIQEFDRAASALAPSAAPSLRVGILQRRGVCHLLNSALDSAMADFTGALEAALAGGSKFLEVESLLLMSAAMRDKGDTAAERKHVSEAVAISQQHGFQVAAAQGLLQLARAYDGSEPDETARNARTAVQTFRTFGRRGYEATALAWLAKVLYSTSDFQQALEAGMAAAKLHRELRNPDGEFSILPLLGTIYARLGDTTKAAAHYQRALAVRREGDKSGEAQILILLARMKADAGEIREAEQLYQKAAAVAVAAKSERFEAAALKALAAIRNPSDPLSARASAERAFNIYNKLGDRRSAAEALMELARLSTGMTALRLYTDALETQKAVRDEFGAATSELAIAGILRRTGDLEQSLKFLEIALQRVEQQRSSIAAAGLRMTYFGQLKPFYDTYVEVLMELHERRPDNGFGRRAFHINERARARVLLDAITGGDLLRAVTVSEELRRRERSLRARIVHAASDPASNNSALIDEWLAEYAILESEIAKSHPEIATATPGSVLTPEQVVDRLAADTTLIAYRLGAERSYVWTVSKTGIQSKVLPPAEVLSRLAVAVAAAQAAPDTVAADQRYWQAAQALSDAVLQPVMPQLANQRIRIVADGELHRIAFAALPVPGKSAAPNPMISRYEVAHAPSASVLLSHRTASRRASAPRILVFADPVFNGADDRLGKNASSTHQGGLPRLPGTKAEAQVVSRIAGEGRADILSDFDATVAAATSAIVKEYDILHFSTHAIVDNVRPDLSGIALSGVTQEGKSIPHMLRMLDVYRLPLRSSLVVLSACRSADGAEAAGEGLVALGRAFLYAGSSSVVATLWPVGSRFPEDFMRRFYTAVYRGASPVTALQHAQRTLAQEGSSPRKWGAFVLLGS